MRTIFFKHLKEIMKENESLFLVSADMGLGLIEPFQQEFPHRFINVGIAEQNMAGVAAGLCNSGFRPVCYTISNFLVERCFEQIRNDICYHNYPVILVGTSTGFDNGMLGPTHHVIDDIGAMKILPEMEIYSPSTVEFSNLIFQEVMKSNKPSYIRIGKGAFDIPLENKKINQMIIKNHKSDILIITHGTLFETCLSIAKELDNISLYCMNKIKPLNTEELNSNISEFSKIIVVEEHLKNSGLYNSLCQHLIESGLNNKLYSISVPNEYSPEVGDRDYFLNKYGLNKDKIKEFIKKIYN
ncbi:MAG: transketolase C-terminal domain-containing protein [Candidatus Sericytochromatia bacterium]